MPHRFSDPCFDKKAPAGSAGASFLSSAADDIQHFTVGLHGLGQILHDLHI